MKSTPQLLAFNALHLGLLDELSFDELLSILMAADDAYYNQDGESFISDSEYDMLRRYAHGLNPEHTYFLGVGSAIRGEKVKLPYPMGGLDQIYEGEITDWVGDWTLQKENMVVTDKLDGTSAMLIFDNNGKLQIAYSRGEGDEASDITRHLRLFTDLPKNIGGPAVIRGEVIFTEATFKILQPKVLNRSGKPYKNARNMVAGLMNAKNNDSYKQLIYSNIRFVAYEIIGSKENKVDDLNKLLNLGFSIPYSTSFHGTELTDKILTEYLKDRRSKSPYRIDGIVLDVDSISKRRQMNPTRDTLNPAYAVKYKIPEEDNQAIATVKEVKWNVSKDGFLKPTVCIAPVDLLGVTIQHATGFNAKFIHDNHIGPGARVSITRSGDVIPFIQSVVEGTKAQMPEGDWLWNETEVDAVLVNHHEHEEVVIQQVLAYFQSINAPMLKEGNIRTMFKWNKYKDFTHAVCAMSNYNEDHWFSCIGENGRKIYNGLRKIYSGIPLYVLMGATPFFGRGVGVRKFKKLLKDLKVRSVDELRFINKAQIISVDGFEDKTATKIVAGMDDFIYFMQRINGLRVLVESGNTGGELQGKKFCFTGFRSKELQSQIEAAGGEVSSGVSRKTSYVVAKTPNKLTGKVKKAVELEIPVIGIEDLEQML